MTEFVTVGRADEVPDGEARTFDVGGRAIAVARIGERWYAFDDTCTHRMCSLSDGDVEDGGVICPCHGSEFDLETGEVLNPPATLSIAVFQVQVEDGEIRIGPVKNGA